ncbi:MAG: UDP-glucose 4-epimerase [Betaproteobacteria bacterium TMED41]|nr:MAG: UDP-glucose 4-epimerase [Betaproteobacteria bacterium TMED41]
MAEIRRILVTGGAGYVGSALVPRLIDAGYLVNVLDLYLYGESIFGDYHSSPNLREIKGDLRDQRAVETAVQDCDAVIHLACISNDPSFELNPKLGKSINLDAFRPLVETSRTAGVGRFIYASSSSVYGVKEESNVHEGMDLEPLTDYSRFKADCEKILSEYQSSSFDTATIRPATVCGYAPRQRLDVVVNILTNLAYHRREITVFGGDQLRPNIHITDMVDAYFVLLEAPSEKIAGKIYNAGYENQTVKEIAEAVKSVVGEDVKLITTPTEDNRSYHISSKKFADELGFVARHSIREAAQNLVDAFNENLLPDSLTDERYFNIKRMQSVDLR